MLYCAKTVSKVMGSRSDRMEEIYSEYDDKVVQVTGGAGFTGSVLPGREDMFVEPVPLYAISKLDCEHLARMFYIDHGLRTTCLRYFNVYGPRQDPNSAYAAAIPIFLSRARAGEDIVIYGDGGHCA